MCVCARECVFVRERERERERVGKREKKFFLLFSAGGEKGDVMVNVK